MTQQTQAVATVAKEDREITYVPFGMEAIDAIKLNITLVKNFIAVKTKQGHTCTEEQAMKAMMFMKARKLNPYEGDCFLIGYDTQDGPQFSVVASHQSYLKRAEVHPEFDGMESGVVVRNSDNSMSELHGDFMEEGQILLGGWAKVYFKNRRYPMYKKLNLSVFDKGFGQWKTNKPGMIVKCVESDALRSAFPSVLGGMYLREEIDLEAERTTVVHSTRSSLVDRSPEQTERKQILAPPPEPKREEPKRPEVSTAPPRTARKPAEKAAVSTPTPAPTVAPNPPFVSSTLPKATEEERTGTVEEPPVEDPTGEGDPFADPESPAALTAKEPPPTNDVVKPLTVPNNVLECAQLIRQALQAQGLEESALMAWAKENNIAGPKMTDVAQMAGFKLVRICNEWPKIVQDLKAGF